MRFLFDVFRLSSCPHEATSLTYTTVRATRAGLFETVKTIFDVLGPLSLGSRLRPCLLDLSRVCQRDADARRRLTPCSAASPPRPPRPPPPGGTGLPQITQGPAGRGPLCRTRGAVRPRRNL